MKLVVDGDESSNPEEEEMDSYIESESTIDRSQR
jgi:hypothetical protein